MTDCPCHECHATQLAAVLHDLIAELRDRAQHYGPRRHRVVSSSTTASMCSSASGLNSASARGDHPDPQAVYGRVWRVWSYLQRQVGEGRHPVGFCQEPHPDPQVDAECGGPLFYTPTALNPVTCANCGWDVSQGAIDIYVAQTDLHTWRETEHA